MSTRFTNYANLMGGGGSGTLPVLGTADVRYLYLDAGLHSTDTTPTGDSFVSDLDSPSASIVVRSGALTTPTFSNGVFDHEDDTISSVAISGAKDSVDEVIYYDNDPVGDAAKLLLVVFDSFSAGAPFTPTGGAVVLQPSGSGVWTF